MTMEKKWVSQLKASLVVMPLLALSVAGIRPAAAEPASQAGPQTFNALLGNEIFTVEGDKSTWQAARFYPESITINAGDSISWKSNSGVDPHTVTLLGADNKFPQVFLPPTGPGEGGGPPNIEINPQAAFATGGNSYDGSTYVNSGIISSDVPGPKNFALTLTKPGTYKFLCLIHSAQLPDGTIVGMQGSVTVQPAGSALARNPAQVLADAEAMAAADKDAAIAAEPEAKKVAVSPRPGPNGTTVYRVNTGYQLSVGELGAWLDYERFSPEDINIRVGDTVEWASPTPRNFHDVVFGEEPDAFIIQPQPAGPPRVFLNGLAAVPVGPNVHTGTGLYTSGNIVGPEDPPDQGVSSYSLTFSQPGRFEYICAYHYSNGMDGAVVVAARTGETPGGDGSIPGMPTTGNGDSTMLILVLASGLLLASTGVGLRLRSRKAVR